MADAAVSLSLEAVCGCARAFDPRVHEARGLAGQIASAADIRELIRGSRLIEKAGAVQDVYSLRCAPAVHGAARDAIAYARRVAEAEINAATDNPLFFPGGEAPFDHEFAANWPAGYDGRERISYSAGNFHGEPVGMAADVLAIALAELANISERRTQMLLDSHQSRNLPGNLIPHRGINSGLMIIQYAAAGIVSENKVLTHPASVDSIPTSANSEDHNAMSTIAARKVRTVLRNAQSVLAIELLVAAQAVEWRVAMRIDPAKPRPKGSSDWEQADQEAKDFEERTAPREAAGDRGRARRGDAEGLSAGPGGGVDDAERPDAGGGYPGGAGGGGGVAGDLICHSRQTALGWAMTDRERLRALVDDLPENEVHAALRFVEHLRNSVAPEVPPAAEEEDAKHGRIISHQGMHRRIFGED